MPGYNQFVDTGLEIIIRNNSELAEIKFDYSRLNKLNDSLN